MTSQTSVRGASEEELGPEPRPLDPQVQSTLHPTCPFHHKEIAGWPEAGPLPGLGCAAIPSLGGVQLNSVPTVS